MITKLIIENFKAIERLELDLGRFNVLVGPNDAGKSTILQALELLGRVASMPLRPALRVPTAELMTRGGNASRMMLGADGQVDSRSYSYRGVISGDALVDERLTPPGLASMERHDTSVLVNDSHAAIRADLASFLARFDPRQLTAQAKLGTPLDNDGSGFAALVDEMLTSANVEPRNRIDAALQRFAPFVRAFGTEVSADRTGKQLTYLLANGGIVSGRQMSDGVVLATALLALRYATSYTRYLIEEPETGVHPRAVGPIIASLRELATTCGAQVIVTTHSPLLLNHVDPEDVIVVTRSAAGIRATRMTETKFFEERISEWSLGELWHNIGERELVPSAS